MKQDSPHPASSDVPPLLQSGGLSRELMRVLLLGFALIFAWRIGHLLTEILLMFAMIFLLAIILNSVVVWLEQRGVRRAIAVALIMMMFISAVFFAGWKIVPTALRQANHLIENAPRYWRDIRSRTAILEEKYPALRDVMPKMPANENAAEDANKASGEAGLPPDDNAPSFPENRRAAPPSAGLQGDALFGYARRAFAFTAGLAGAIFIGVLSFLLLTFTLARPQELVGGLLSVVPANLREPTRRSLARIFMQMSGWSRAVCINGAIAGTLTGTGMALIGVQPALVLGICAFFGEFVPSLGPMAAAMPSIFVALSISPTKGLEALGVILAIQAVVSNAINPIIMGREMKLHPATIMFFALSMGKIFGIAGAILAVPSAAIAKILVEEFYLFPHQVPQAEIAAQARAIVAGQSGVEEPDAQTPRAKSSAPGAGSDD